MFFAYSGLQNNGKENVLI